MAKINPHPIDKSKKVQQHHRVGNSPNDIMRRHLSGPSRLLPPGDPRATVKMEFRYISADHYHDMLNKVADVKTRFMSYPARIRSRFGNDPYQMLRFVEDPQNRSEALRMGIVDMTDEEFDNASVQAEADRMNRVREAMGQQTIVPRPDPEAQPDYGRKAPPEPQKPPQKGGNGG